MVKINTYKLNSGAIDASGNASATSNPIHGIIKAIKVIYTSGNSGDMTLKLVELNPETTDVSKALQTILSTSSLGATPEDDNNVYYPRRAAQDYQANDLYYEVTNAKVVPVEFVINGLLSLDISSGTAGDSVLVEVQVEEF